MTYQQDLMRNRFAQAALSIPGLQQPRLLECAEHLLEMEMARGKEMSADHLKQESRKWVKARNP